jgi:hypothetical protein
MKVLIYVDKIEALKVGKDKYGFYVVEIPAAEFTPEQREYLSKCTRVNNKYEDRADFDISHLSCFDSWRSMFSHLCVEPTKETVFNLIEAKLGYDRKEKEKVEESNRQRLAELMAMKPEEILYETTTYTPITHKVWQVQNHSVEFPQMKAKMELAQQIANERNAKSRDAALKEDEEHKAEEANKKANIQKLKAWAVQHGSELLKKRIEGGFSWRTEAQKEFGFQFLELRGLSNAFIKEDDEDDCKYEDLRSPTLVQMEALEVVKKILNDAFPDADEEPTAKLKLTTYKDGYEKSSRVEIEINFPLLDNTTATYYLDTDLIGKS